MNDQLVCELNLALIPETDLARRLISFSREMGARSHSIIELNGVAPWVAFTPHITVYQVATRVRDLPGIRAALRDVVSKSPQLSLGATEYGSNANEGSFEVRYEAAATLMKLQDATIRIVNPRRGSLLLERDPAGRPLTERIEEAGQAGDNIRRTGFDAVGDPAQGGLFQPHVTLNWFEPGAPIEPHASDLPSPRSFNGHFTALGIFLLGPYGTCAQRLAALPFAA
jgi:hypothetical protein